MAPTGHQLNSQSFTFVTRPRHRRRGLPVPVGSEAVGVQGSTGDCSYSGAPASGGSQAAAHTASSQALPGLGRFTALYSTELSWNPLHCSVMQHTELLSCILMHCICNLLHLLQANQLAHNTCSRRKLLDVALGQNKPMRAARLNGVQIYNVCVPLWL